MCIIILRKTIGWWILVVDRKRNIWAKINRFLNVPTLKYCIAKMVNGLRTAHVGHHRVNAIVTLN